MFPYGIIGNCHTAALVDKFGSIDWFCYPSFSSPSIFAALLDCDKGGRFSFEAQAETSQEYIPNTNILQTTLTTKDWTLKITDFFPRFKSLADKKVIGSNYFVRLLEPIRGVPKVKVVFDPRPDYAKVSATLEQQADAVVVRGSFPELKMRSNAPIDCLLSRQELMVDKEIFFAFGEFNNGSKLGIAPVKALLRATRKYWEDWVGSLTLPLENKEAIIRSALTLKLLAYSNTGAIVAAATTSIPEEPGSARCWDYRFCWVRDSVYAIDALIKIGRVHEAKKFIDFIMQKVIEDDHLQIMYGIEGETKLTEQLLEHLSGYKGGRPVRVGNAAYNQDQHDIYGELVDILFLYFVYYQFEPEMKPKHWKFLRYLVNQIRFNWEKKDSGIWEFRERREHFTYSKLMCFVGVDRAIKIAQHFAQDDLASKWVLLRDEIRSDILKNGFDQQLGSFTMFYGSKSLDASLLQMTYHEFLEPSDPRLVSTIKKIYEELRDDFRVKRYEIEDDFGLSSSSFTICSFWLVDALIYIGEVDKAREIFAKLSSCSNHLGLFSEDLAQDGEQAGNFPQAYTHIAHINTSILFSEWSAKRKKIDWSRIKRSAWF